VQLLESHLANLVDYQFTAQMEDDLDAISRGEQEYLDYLSAFYFGNGARHGKADSPASARLGLKKQLEHKVEEIDARDISRIWIGTPEGGHWPMKRRPMR
jgi:DNA topoisomerase-1